MVSVRGNQTNNKVTASPSTSTNNRAEVKPVNINNQVEATNNLAKYYSEISQEWAVGEGLIQNIDYSSKTYALQSKEYANNAKESMEITEEYMDNAISNIQTAETNALSNIVMQEESALSTVNQGIEQLNTTITEGLDNINTSVTSGVETIETLQANSIAEITTNKESALSDITTAETNTLAQISTLANTSISDINAVGKSYDNLTYRNITNCLLEVPQRIKLELNNGTLTLKAGSEVIVPNGFESNGTTPKFDYETVESDISLTGGTTGTRFGFYSINAQTFLGVINTYVYSGDTAKMNSTSAITYGRFYNTQTNKIYVGNSNGGSWVETRTALPICIFRCDENNTIAYLDQVFNGMGYIDSYVWVDKDVKGLIPDGRNEDGSLRNIEYTHNRLEITSRNVTGYNPVIIGNSRPITIGTQPYTESAIQLPASNSGFSVYLNTSENIFYVNNGSAWIASECFLVATASVTSGVINGLQAKQPFRAVDYNDYASTPHIVQTYVSGTSWYRVWSDGWLEQGGVVSMNEGTNAAVTFAKNFTTTNYTVEVTPRTRDVEAECGSRIFVHRTLKTTGFTIGNRTVRETGVGIHATWYVCGY